MVSLESFLQDHDFPLDIPITQIPVFLKKYPDKLHILYHPDIKNYRPFDFWFSSLQEFKVLYTKIKLETGHRPYYLRFSTFLFFDEVMDYLRLVDTIAPQVPAY